MENNKGNKISDNREYYEDEIDLFELIHLLLKNKKLIALITAITTVAVFVVSAFIIKPVYQTELKFQLSVPSVVATEYGEYDAGLNNNQDVVNVLNEDEFYKVIEEDLGYNQIKSSIISSQDITSLRDLVIEIQDTDIAKINQLVEALPTAYEDYLDNKIQEDYLEYYKKFYEAEIVKNEKDIEIINELLINARKIAETEPKFLDGTNEINPNWIKTQGYVLDHVKTIEDRNTYIQISKKKLALIEQEEQAANGEASNDFTADILKFDQDTTSIAKISPNIKLNTAVGLVLGLMIAIFYVFARAWWKNSQADIKARWNQYK